MKEHYDRRAAQDDQTTSDGLDPQTAAALAREGVELGRMRASLPVGRMLKIAGTRIPAAQLVRATVPPLPFADAALRVFTSRFDGHLEQPERLAFLAEARRVAPELVMLDSA